MAFIEEAILKVVDQSSGTINKINAELKKLQQTARSLKDIKVNIQVNTSSLQRAIGQVNQLKSAINSVGASQKSLINPINQVGSALQKQQASMLQFRQNWNNLNQASAAQIMKARQGTQAYVQGLVQAQIQAAKLANAPIPGQFTAGQMMQFRRNMQNYMQQQANQPLPPPQRSLLGRMGAPAGRFAGGYLMAGGPGAGLAGATMFGGAGVAGFAAAELVQLAGKAIKFALNETQTRDRTELQAAVQASALQRKIFKNLGGENTPIGAFKVFERRKDEEDREYRDRVYTDARHRENIRDVGEGRLGEFIPTSGISLTRNERMELWSSVLGDVQGNEAERAQAAFNLAKRLEVEMLPRVFATNTGMSREDALKGLLTNIKSMNLATGQLVDAQGNFTTSGERVFDAITMARAVNPELDPKLIKTTMANMKSGAFIFDRDSLTKILLSAGDRGARAGNEAYQAYLAATGTIANAPLNNALEKAGLLLDPAHKMSKKGKQGNVIPGTGTPIDNSELIKDPGKWWHDHLLNPMANGLSRVDEYYKGHEAELAKKEHRAPIKYESLEQYAAARDTAGEGADAVASRLLGDYVQRTFPSMRQTARQFITDQVLAFQQQQAALEQAALAMNQDVPAAIADSWAARTQQLIQKIKDAAGTGGEAALRFVDAAGNIKKLSDWISGGGDLETVESALSRLKQVQSSGKREDRSKIQDLLDPWELTRISTIQDQVRRDTEFNKLLDDTVRALEAKRNMILQNEINRLAAVKQMVQDYSPPEHPYITQFNAMQQALKASQISLKTIPIPNKQQLQDGLNTAVVDGQKYVVKQLTDYETDRVPEWMRTLPRATPKPLGGPGKITDMPYKPKIDTKTQKPIWPAWPDLTPEQQERILQRSIDLGAPGMMPVTKAEGGAEAAPTQTAAAPTSDELNQQGTTLASALSDGASKIESASGALKSNGEAAGKAIADGGASAAGQIRTAMSTPINVNVNVTGAGTKPDAGNQSTNG